MQTHDIPIGVTATGATIALPLKFANRHGLITGVTGGGKTVTMQKMIEGLSAAGVPVFAADIKGDLSGVGSLASADGHMAQASARLGVHFTPDRFPVRFWDLFGVTGAPIRTTVHEMGPLLMARMLGLNDNQAAVLTAAFRHARNENEWLMDISDLRTTLSDMVDNREMLVGNIGHFTSASVNIVIRQLFTLEAQGGDHLFGDPVLDINDLIAVDENGRGVINLVDADKLMQAPKLYATFLLWLLTAISAHLPEAGDLAKPIMAFFFDEAHLLFKDAPAPLLESIEQTVRLIRSKGVGVYFVTQSPADVPSTVMAQLSNRVQHALRAYTPEHQKMVTASAKAFRPPGGVKKRAWLEMMEQAITQLAKGEAFASLLTSDGVPCEVERIRVIPPSGHVGPMPADERSLIIANDQLALGYARVSERERSRRMFMRRIFALEGLAVDGLPSPDDALPAWAMESVSDPFAAFNDALEGARPVRSYSVAAAVKDLAKAALWGLAAFAAFRLAFAIWA